MKIGFEFKFFAWLRSFLCTRTQIVKIRNALSRPLPDTSGVPQGGVPSPLLLLIYINDLLQLPFHSRVQAYADDLKLISLEYDHAKTKTDLAFLEHKIIA